MFFCAILYVFIVSAKFLLICVLCLGQSISSQVMLFQSDALFTFGSEIVLLLF